MNRMLSKIDNCAYCGVKWWDVAVAAADGDVDVVVAADAAVRDAVAPDDCATEPDDGAWYDGDGDWVYGRTYSNADFHCNWHHYCCHCR